MLIRRANLSVMYENTDISEIVEAYVENFSYTDNASGSADNISITVNNESKIWLNSWKPCENDIIQAYIFTSNWRYDGDSQKLSCGKFYVDEFKASGRPLIAIIGAICTPISNDFINTSQSRSWESITLKEIAETIATYHSIDVYYDTTFNPSITYLEQSNESDSKFLYNLLADKGLAVKIFSDKLVIFSEQEYEEKEAIATLDEIDLEDWDIGETWTDTGYKGCQVSYTDPNSDETFTYTFYDETSDSTKIYKVNETVDSLYEAELKAKSKLRNLNKNQYPLSIKLMGNTEMIPCACINMTGLGEYDGKFYIDKAVHSVGDGYTTSLELHKVLEGY